MVKRKVDAAVFDVDGMLLDTREFIFQAFEHSLAVHGHPVPDRAAISQHMGKSLETCYLALAPEGNIELLCDTHHKFQARKMELVLGYEGLHDMLDTLRNAGLALGAFSSRKSNLIPSLENSGILEYFGAVVQGGDVANHKPHPEGLLKVLDTLGVLPARAAMLGDAAVDIEAGKAAGVALTVGITHGFGTREALLRAEPDHIVDSLKEIPPLLLG